MLLRRPALLVLLLLLLPGPAGTAAGAAGPAIELRADEVTVRQGGALVEARGRVRITDGRNRLTADRALYTVRARRFSLSGRVTITTPQGELRAASATAVLGSGPVVQTITAAGEVVFESPDRRIRAARLTYDATTGAISAEGGVEVGIRPDIVGRGQTLLIAGGDVTLRGSARVLTADGYVEGDRIDFAERTGVATVRGNVTGAFDQTRITAAAATFDARRRQAVFRDGVQVTRPGRTITAQTVTIFLQDRRLVAEGETTIRIEDDSPP